MLKNKKILITGIANKFSIANGIAVAMAKNGAELDSYIKMKGS